MKHVANENAFRTWFTTEYLGIDGKYPSIFSPDEIEMAVQDKCLKDFPVWLFSFLMEVFIDMVRRRFVIYIARILSNSGTILVSNSNNTPCDKSAVNL
jgi:hypothetical protein